MPKRLYVGAVPFVMDKSEDASGRCWIQWHRSFCSLPQIFSALAIMFGTLIVIFPTQKHYFTWSGATPGIVAIAFGVLLGVLAWYLADYRMEIRMDAIEGQVSWGMRARGISFNRHSAAIDQAGAVVRRAIVRTTKGTQFWKGHLLLIQTQESMVALAAFRNEGELNDVQRTVEWPFDIDRSQVDLDPIEALGSPAWIDRKLW